MKKRIVILVIILTSILLFLIGGFLFYYKLPTPSFERINFLILGIGGKGHTGEDLTDSIIFVSINSLKGNVLILSVPRDIWIPQWQTKLNSIYHYKGPQETKHVLEEILGKKIDYTLIIDFEAFKKIIDFLEGVEVEVIRSFDDYKYPIAGKENDLCNGDPQFKCRYEHIHFEAGKQLMNGETALKYIRSRNAVGEEGTDFARASRQQQLLLGIKKKVFSPEFLLKPGNLLQFFKLLKSDVKFYIPQEKIWELIRVFLRVRKGKIKTAVLNSNYLINPSQKEKYNNQWVLIPKKGNWEEIHEYVNSLLNF